MQRCLVCCCFLTTGETKDSEFTIISLNVKKHKAGRVQMNEWGSSMKIIGGKTSMLDSFAVLLWLVWLRLPGPKETLSENNKRFLPLLSSGFHWDNGEMKWQRSSEGREKGLWNEIEKNRGPRQQEKPPVSRLPLFYQPSPSLANRKGCFVLWALLWTGVFREPSGRLLCHSGLRQVDGLTHPVQAAQVLHHVLVCACVVVNHSMLFVHTSRLQGK